jgi:hypothetical protein
MQLILCLVVVTHNFDCTLCSNCTITCVGVLSMSSIRRWHGQWVCTNWCAIPNSKIPKSESGDQSSHPVIGTLQLWAEGDTEVFSCCTEAYANGTADCDTG